MDQFTNLKHADRSAKEALDEFTESQKESWSLAKTNYEGLKGVKNKEFQFDGFKIKVQYNPKRILSSAAKVDRLSIAERTCFLCTENRPVEQKAIAFGDQYLILVNPYPIFKTHLTITSTIHTDQRFLPNIQSMLHLSVALEGFTVFYNGPEAGASAPDHMHFQAGERGFMLVDEEFEELKKQSGKQLFSGEKTRIWVFNDYLRKMISVETSSFDEGLIVMKAYCDSFKEFQPEKVEPMMNVLCSWSKGIWTIHLFPRKTHRPTQYFATGDDQLLISPGAVDMGGVIIIPRREDFDRIEKEDIVSIMEQVSIDEETYFALTDRIIKELKNNSHIKV